MAESKDGQSMRVDSALLRQLAKMLSDNDLTEIEVEDGDRKLRVVRAQVRDLLTSSPSFAALPPAPVQAIAEPTAADAPVDAVKSPMVGTCFLSPEPGAKPFIAVGERVSEGDTLLIIEAMKVMNPILSSRSGTVRQILIADSQAVEYDQPLVVIE